MAWVPPLKFKRVKVGRKPFKETMAVKPNLHFPSPTAKEWVIEHRRDIRRLHYNLHTSGVKHGKEWERE